MFFGMQLHNCKLVHMKTTFIGELRSLSFMHLTVKKTVTREDLDSS